MIATLADLVAPLPVHDFHEMLRRREPCIFRSNDPHRHTALLDWGTMSEVVLSGTFPVEKLRVTRNGWVLPNVLYRDGDMPKRDIIAPLLQAGGSIIAHGIEPCVPALTELCTSISAEIGERVTVGAIASTGKRGALDIHYDHSDLLIMQVEGGKRWMIQQDPFVDPIEGVPHASSDDDAPLLIDMVLEAGDWLFLPAGYRHHCETAGERSLHIGVFLHPLTAPRTMDLLRDRLIADPVARKPIRFDPGEAESVERALKQQLIDQVVSLSLDELIALHRAP